MTVLFTQFVNASLTAFPDSVTDPDVSHWMAQLDEQIRYNVDKRKVEEVTLDDGDSYVMSLSNLGLTDWAMIVVRCIGQGTVDLLAKDASAVNITSSNPVFGNSILPGILLLSTYNLRAAPTITSQADGSVFEIYVAMCSEDA